MARKKKPAEPVPAVKTCPYCNQTLPEEKEKAWGRQKK